MGVTAAVLSAVVVGAAASSLLGPKPSSATAGAAIAPAIKVHVTDSFGNDVPGVQVAMTLSSGTGTLSGTTSRTSDSSGVATFNDLSINLSGSKNLTASSTRLRRNFQAVHGRRM